MPETLPTTTELQPQKPLKSNILTKWNTAIQNLSDDRDAVYDSGVPRIETDLVDQTSIAASAVGRGELKTASETLQSNSSTGVSQALTFSSVGEYGLLLQQRITASHSQSVTSEMECGWAPSYAKVTVAGSGSLDSGYFTRVGVRTNSGVGIAANQAHARVRYIQSSPPHYLLGDDPWGQWVYLLLAPGDEVVRAWTAIDPPWDLRRGLGLHPRARRLWKRDPTRFLVRPHPFLDDVPEIPTGHRVVLLDLREWEQDTERCPVEAERERALAQAEEWRERGIPAEVIEGHMARCEEECAEAAAERARAKAQLDDLPETPEEWAAQRAHEVGKVVRAGERDLAAAKRDRVRVEQALTDAARDPARSREALRLERTRDDLEAFVAMLSSRIEVLRTDTEERAALLAARAEGQLAARRTRLRREAGILTIRERLEIEAEERGGDLLDLVRARHPDIDRALGGSPPPERDLPPIPGLFQRGQDGSAPTVIILSPK